MAHVAAWTDVEEIPDWGFIVQRPGPAVCAWLLTCSTAMTLLMLSWFLANASPVQA